MQLYSKTRAWVFRSVTTRGYCYVQDIVIHRVRTDPGKVWKVMEFKGRNFQVWKIVVSLGMEKFGKVMEFVTADLEN